MMRALHAWARAVRRGAAGMALAWLALGPAQAALLRVDVQDDAGRPLPGAVAYLESTDAKAAARPGATVEIVQAGRQFSPAVTVIPTGTQVRFPNRDRYRHQVYSFSPAKKFELQLYAGTQADPVLFDRSGIVVLGCNIHDDMVAWVVVVDTPYYASADAAGHLQIDRVPPGNYRLRAWHPTLPPGAAAQEQALSVIEGGAPVAVRLAGARP